MRAALTEAIADTEAALMEMKRSRLLQQLSGSTAQPHGAEPPGTRPSPAYSSASLTPNTLATAPPHPLRCCCYPG